MDNLKNNDGALISIMLVDNTIKIPWRDLYAIIDVK